MFQTILKRCHGMSLNCAIDSSTLSPDAVLSLLLQAVTAHPTLLSQSVLSLTSLIIRLHNAVASSSPTPPTIVQYIRSLPLAPAVAVRVLAALPELATAEMGSRKISIDPRYLQALYTELETRTDEVNAFVQELYGSFPNKEEMESLLVTLYTQWAYYIPVPASFVPLDFVYSQLPNSVSTLVALFDPYSNSAEGSKKPRDRGKQSTNATYSNSRVPSRLAAASLLLTIPPGSSSPFPLKTLIDIADPMSPGGTGYEVITTLTQSTLVDLAAGAQYTEQFNVLSELLLALCTINHGGVRCMILDAIDSVCSGADGAVAPTSTPLPPSVVLLATKCAIALGHVCSYPREYFTNPMNAYDFELEVERNAVRDLIRTVTPNPASTLNMLKLCLGEMKQSVTETGVHAFSALCKSVHSSIAKSSVADSCAAEISEVALGCFELMLPFVLGLANGSDPSLRLQFSRISLLAISSSVATLNLIHPLHPSRVAAIVNSSAQLACTTCVAVREYPNAVTDLNTFLNTGEARSGTFHSPGGEDHLGSLLINRLCSEPGPILQIMAAGMRHFIDLHSGLLEGERRAAEGRMMMTGKSRRLVLQGVARLCVVSSEHSEPVLHSLLSSTVAVINDITSSQPTQHTLATLCDAILDIAEFGDVLSSNILSEHNLASVLTSIHSISNVVNAGYNQYQMPEEVVHHWGRCRVAYHYLILSLFRGNGGVGVSTLNMTFGALVNVVNVETTAASAFVRQGEYSGVFTTGLGDTLIEPGCFIHAITRTPSAPAHLQSQIAFASEIATGVLELLSYHLTPELLLQRNSKLLKRNESLEVTRGSIDDDSDDERDADGNSEDDPRNPTCEAFVLLLKKLIDDGASGAAFEAIISRTVYVLVLDMTVGGAAAASGMSFDDSCTLCILDLFGACLHNLAILEQVGSLFSAFFMTAKQRGCEVRSSAAGSEALATPAGAGAAMIVAALLNASSGRLPPWALEYIPASLQSMGVALATNLQVYEHAVNFAIDCHVAVVAPGAENTPRFPLSGRFISKQKPVAKQNLRDCFSKCLAKSDWKEMKNGLKVACGGKKKQAGFKLKPSLRRFENSRV
jgi:hypothetical protein